MLDTLEYSDSLTDAGVPADQARVHAKALSEAVESNNFATSADIARLETTISSEISRLETTTSADIARLEAKLTVMGSDFTVRMSEMKLELIKWGVGMVFALSGIMFALLRFMLP